MRRSFVWLCAITTIAGAARAEAAQDRQGRETREEGTGTEHGNNSATMTGCLQQGSTPRSFVLQQPGTNGPQGGAGIAVVSHKMELSQYLGETVQMSGVMTRRGGPEGHGGPTGTRMDVREIRRVAASCSVTQPTPQQSAASSSGAAGSASTSTTGTAPGSAATPSSDTTTTTTGSSGVTGVSGDAMLDGLFNLNIQQLLVSIQLSLNLQDAVINVNDVLNGFQIQALIQALNSNPVALLNATNLSLALQQSGLLAPGETVVGVTPPAIRDNKTLTQALQQQGILLPGERVVGAKGPRVYKMKS
jgi:hypothetical protein